MIFENKNLHFRAYNKCSKVYKNNVWKRTYKKWFLQRDNIS